MSGDDEHVVADAAINDPKDAAAERRDLAIGPRERCVDRIGSGPGRLANRRFDHRKADPPPGHLVRHVLAERDHR